MNIFKVFQVGERTRFRFESRFGNIFDRDVFCDPNQNFSSPASAGQHAVQHPRSVQLGFRFEF